jgi:hypothetical protein
LDTRRVERVIGKRQATRQIARPRLGSMTCDQASLGLSFA